MKSKTKINAQLQKKRNPEVVETVLSSKKNSGWFRVSEILASPRQNHAEKNLDSINRESKEGETIVIPGKVLSMGNLDKKIKLVAFKFSKNAIEKITKSGSSISTISEEIKNNPEAKGVRIIE